MRTRIECSIKRLRREIEINYYRLPCYCAAVKFSRPSRPRGQAAAKCRKYNIILRTRDISTHKIYCKRRTADSVATDHSNESPTNFRPKASEASFLEFPFRSLKSYEAFDENPSRKSQPDRFERLRTVFADFIAKSNPND